MEIVDFQQVLLECTDVSYVAGEGVGLTVYKESVVIEEIKEVKRRSRLAQFIYDRNYNRNTVMHLARLPVKKVRRLVTQRRKVRVYRKISFLTIPPHSQLIPQP